MRTHREKAKPKHSQLHHERIQIKGSHKNEYKYERDKSGR
jgi:hypothetical protein